jgi:hypothetical protein
MSVLNSRETTPQPAGPLLNDSDDGRDSLLHSETVSVSNSGSSLMPVYNPHTMPRRAVSETSSNDSEDGRDSLLCSETMSVANDGSPEYNPYTMPRLSRAVSESSTSEIEQGDATELWWAEAVSGL